MDSIRFVLILSLALVSMLLWDAWQRDYGVSYTGAGQAGRTSAQPRDDRDIPQIRQTEVAVEYETKEGRAGGAGARLITVETDVLRLKINQGGAIVFAELLDYPVSLERKDTPFVLLDSSPSLLYVIQSGIIGDLAPNHKDTLLTGEDTFRLEEDEATLEVPLNWSSPEGVSVTKVFTFQRGSYLIGLEHIIENNSGANWRGRQYTQIKRDDPSREGRRLIYTYTGAILSSPEDRYEKIDFDDMAEGPLEKSVINGWAAMIQHYFLTAILPTDKQAAYQYYTRAFSNESLYAIGNISPGLSLADGQRGVLSGDLYIGPKTQAQLKHIADGLDLTVDYGVLWFLAKPLFWCLQWLFDLIGNWGWSIILVTVLLKVVFYHLSAAGYRSMANMRRVQPRIMSMRERYKNDKTRLNQAMMHIYKEEKINPFGGCFPILIQIPVFIALYWVLLESVELRQASFILWLNDLSIKDPYFVLPVIMGATMLVQQKLNPAPMDPIQEKVLKLLPFVFTVFFAFFPSGLVLYWVTNNILSIAQQWLIMKNLEKDMPPSNTTAG